MRFERITQPASEPLSVAEAQLWIPGAEANWLTAAIPIIREWLELELSRILAESQWNIWLDMAEIAKYPPTPIVPLIQLDSIIAFGDDGSEYRISTTGSWARGMTIKIGDEGLAQLSGLSLRPTDSVALVVRAGHGHAATSPIPLPILLGFREALAYWNINRGEGFALLRAVPQDVGTGGGVQMAPPVPKWILSRLANFYHRA